MRGAPGAGQCRAQAGYGLRWIRSPGSVPGSASTLRTLATCGQRRPDWFLCSFNIYSRVFATYSMMTVLCLGFEKSF